MGGQSNKWRGGEINENEGVTNHGEDKIVCVCVCGGGGITINDNE
jgi:hypothetical protein